MEVSVNRLRVKSCGRFWQDVNAKRAYGRKGQGGEGRSGGEGQEEIKEMDKSIIPGREYPL